MNSSLAPLPISGAGLAQAPAWAFSLLRLWRTGISPASLAGYRAFDSLRRYHRIPDSARRCGFGLHVVLPESWHSSQWVPRTPQSIGDCALIRTQEQNDGCIRSSPS